jgi:RNA polymerase sigma factor for flagellar operon FliA
MASVDIAAVLPGIRGMARRTPLARNGAIDVDDLQQEAAVGLVQAARSFDPERGTRFETHAFPRARGAILDGQRAVDHVPRSWRAAQRRVVKARTALVAELAREPTPEELAGRLEISTQELRDIEERCRPPGSLTDPLEGQAAQGEQLTVADVVADEDPLPEELLFAREDAALLHAAIGQLPARQQFVIRATWFMDVSSRDLADILGVSPSRVSQLRSDAMERLGVTLNPPAA